MIGCNVGQLTLLTSRFPHSQKSPYTAVHSQSLNAYQSSNTIHPPFIGMPPRSPALYPSRQWVQYFVNDPLILKMWPYHPRFDSLENGVDPPPPVTASWPCYRCFPPIHPPTHLSEISHYFTSVLLPIDLLSPDSTVSPANNVGWKIIQWYLTNLIWTVVCVIYSIYVLCWAM